MNNESNETAGQSECRSQATVYRIRVGGYLEPERSTWFSELEISAQDRTTVLTGSLPDQPALFGVLLRIRDLGLELISVERLAE